MKNSDEAEKQLQMQKMQALGQFAGGIAHDFNNILSIIEGHTEAALRQLKDGTLTPEQLQKVLRSTQRGAGLTRQLLSFSRQKVDAEEKADMGEALRQQKVMLQPLLGASIRLTVTAPEMPLWVAASADQLMQVVMNLALNARDAMPRGGDLSIACAPCLATELPRLVRAAVPYVRLSVTDSGAGIAPDVLPRIFEPFFTTKAPGLGTGLGLSVVYGIVDQLRGTVEVSSTPGAGARFDVFLPAAVAPTREETRRAFPACLAGRTILIAEDEPELRETLSSLCSSMEMKVLAADNGSHALAVQDGYAGDIDFLLTDVVMPEMDGVQLGEAFTALRPDSSIVYMSGYPFLDGRRDIQVPRGAPFIRKPLSEDMVRRVLARALERRRARIKDH